jgi:glycosyltransferase involved in cell wall biosynthesis
MNTTPPQKVGIAIKLVEPGGIQSCALSLIRGLNARGIVPDVLWDLPPVVALLDEAGVQAGYRHVHFPVSSQSIARMPGSLRYLMSIANAVRGRDLDGAYDFFYSFSKQFLFPPEMPHLYYVSGPPLLPQLFSFPRGLRGVPLRVFVALYRSCLRRSRPVYDHVPGMNMVINSEYTARLFYEAHGFEVPVVHPPINLAGRSFTREDLNQRDSLVFFSRIVDYKRPDWVLRLAAQHRQYRCVIMGGVTSNRRDFFRAMQQRAQDLDLNAVFLANPSNEVVREQLKRARFYIFPAINEHFGMTTPEAIASGCIPFVHNSGGQVEIVPDERLRFNDADMQTRFDALVQLPDAELHAMRTALAAHVRQYSEEHFIAQMLWHLDNFSGVDSAAVAADRANCR